MLRFGLVGEVEVEVEVEEHGMFSDPCLAYAWSFFNCIFGILRGLGSFLNSPNIN